MTNQWQADSAGDPRQLASLIVEFDKVLASDLRAFLRDSLDDPSELDPSDERTRALRVWAISQALDQELGEDEHIYT